MTLKGGADVGEVEDETAQGVVCLGLGARGRDE
jgi:hypothetical protein